jgi:DNA-binding transcriptional ArsR family regulator
MDITPIRRAGADRVAEALDGDFFHALCEPARIAILRRLIAIGRADVGAIAAGFDQDRSVISRHLAVLRDAGLVYAEPAGRRIFYDIDGPAVLARLRELTDRLAAVVPTCCPGPRAEACR